MGMSVAAMPELSGDRAGSEFVERKGRGHPDTMADLLAQTFSHRYSKSCIERYGFVPNHWVDKVTLVGAAATVDFGGFSLQSPMRALLIGKVTRSIGGDSLEVEALFERAVADVLTASTGDESIAESVVSADYSTWSRTPDHHRDFYAPNGSRDAQRQAADEPYANDTVICCARSGYSSTEQLVLDLEGLATGQLRERIPALGADVKVVAVRRGTHLDIIVCLPVHPDAVDTWGAYAAIRDEATAELTQYVDDYLPGSWTAGVRSNARDSPGVAYLAPFGTSLGKGDCGVVGRGNRAEGIISTRRAAGVEAPSGKNPMNHAGLLYSETCRSIAQAAADLSGEVCEVTIAAQIGDPLSRPRFVQIDVGRAGKVPPALSASLVEIAHERLSAMSEVSRRLVNEDPLAQFVL